MRQLVACTEFAVHSAMQRAKAGTAERVQGGPHFISQQAADLHRRHSQGQKVLSFMTRPAAAGKQEGTVF